MKIENQIYWFNRIQNCCRSLLPLFFSCFLFFVCHSSSLFANETEWSHAISLYKGDIKYPADFLHFDYVNPDAPKGGVLKLSSQGTFDSLNPFVLKGTPATNTGFVYETLAVASQDEEYTHYGLVAELMRVADDYEWIEYKLNPKARFQDGSKITADDVIWSFNVLKSEGHPVYRNYYQRVKTAVKTAEDQVKFIFTDANDSELPMTTGQLPVLSQKFWQGRKFDSDLLAVPNGSGPYKIAYVDPGDRIVFERDSNWWGADLPVNRGKYNFDQVMVDYYKDSDVMFQGFMGGDFDFRLENVARNWATAYDGVAAIQDGRMKKQAFKHSDPVGLQAFIFNMRKPVFSDVRVREAIALMFDFEWTNKSIFYNQYVRSHSFFNNTDLAAPLLPTKAEKAFFKPHLSSLPDGFLKESFAYSQTQGDGNIRSEITKALALLEAAGWVLDEGKLKQKETGAPFAFEIMQDSRTMDRLIQPFLRNLERIGIFATVRYIDDAQYEKRLEDFEFDMTMIVIEQNLNPGTEQLSYWTSAVADQKGSANYSGLKDPFVDMLVDRVLAAESREELRLSVQELDRVLLWHHIVIPLYYIGDYRLAWWDRFSYPEIQPKYGLSFPEAWWIDPVKAEKLQKELDRAPYGNVRV